MTDIKISVSSYSFQQLISQKEHTQLSIIPLAKEMGFDGIEFVDFQNGEEGFTADYAGRVREECQKHGLAITSFTFGADFLNGSGGDTQKEIARVKENIDIAHILGVPLIRHDVTNGDGRTYEQVLPILADACRQVTEYTQEKGICTTTENHGMFSQDSIRLEQLITRVNHPNFGILGDMGNFLCADEPPELAFGRLAPFIRYAHAKDFHKKDGAGDDPGAGFFKSRGGNYLRGAIVGHGCVPVRQCLQILKQAGFSGWVAIEFEGLECPKKALPIALSNLRRYLAG